MTGKNLESNLAELNDKISELNHNADKAYRNKDYQMEDIWDSEAKPFIVQREEVRKQLFEQYGKLFKMQEEILDKYENFPITLGITTQGLAWVGSLTLREISAHKSGDRNYIYFKVDGTNGKTGGTEQLKLYLDGTDAETIIERVTEIKNQK